MDQSPAPPQAGRPRSEQARRAVLHAVDDLLVEIGYSAMTIKGIAERAGVGRQTVYRWWSTKAEILLEACVVDAAAELHTAVRSDPRAELVAYLRALNTFLTASPAGLGYRALIGEAQHDPAVRDLVRAANLLDASARPVLHRVRARAPEMPDDALAAAQLTGPVLTLILTAQDPVSERALRAHVVALLRGWGA
ncbi:TetR/AcrR family transcriptional regulator [Actinoplanes sp. NPDC051494]|uniref:TetR/AcrR family transcriptional regulator n=1 Tax=Actinoplanes sp. NPDC051494 TaxID=3363907 RepID=UPI00378BD29C